MKRFLSFVLMFVVVLSLAACQNTPTPTTTEPDPSQSTTLPEETEFPVPPALKEPVTGDFTEKEGDVTYTGEASEYQVSLGFTATTGWESFTFSLLSWETETYTVAEELFTGSLGAGKTFVAKVTFWGDMTTYGLAITDENGNKWQYAVYCSGMDGSLILEPVE